MVDFFVVVLAGAFSGAVVVVVDSDLVVHPHAHAFRRAIAINRLVFMGDPPGN
jgi:hypothetical protein